MIRAASIRHYWILDPQLRTLEMLRLERGAYVHTVSPSEGTIRTAGFRGLVIDLDSLWAEIDRADRASRRRR